MTTSDLVARLTARANLTYSYPIEDILLLRGAADELDRLNADNARLREAKDGAYEERNRVVALLASVFPSGVRKTAIPGWEPEWHDCVYIDLPTGQASWHYHDSQAHLFAHLPPYRGEWDGHTTDVKYERVARAALAEKEEK